MIQLWREVLFIVNPIYNSNNNIKHNEVILIQIGMNVLDS
jgi:hypothetical protein